MKIKILKIREQNLEFVALQQLFHFGMGIVIHHIFDLVIKTRDQSHSCIVYAYFLLRLFSQFLCIDKTSEENRESGLG